MAEEKKFELVICIVNAGFSQVVVEAARKAGARGGSIIRGRGTANPEAEEFFGVTIQPDKEIVLTLVPSEIKDEVLKTIYQESGISKEGQGIAGGGHLLHLFQPIGKGLRRGLPRQTGPEPRRGRARQHRIQPLGDDRVHVVGRPWLPPGQTEQRRPDFSLL